MMLVYNLVIGVYDKDNPEDSNDSMSLEEQPGLMKM